LQSLVAVLTAVVVMAMVLGPKISVYGHEGEKEQKK
jgi:hypothetical protein